MLNDSGEIMIKDKIVNFEKKLQEHMKDVYCPTHLSLGHEEVAEEIHNNIKDIDWLFSNHRNHHHYLAKGGDEKKLWDEIMGKKNGLNKGFAGSQGVTDRNINFHASAILGGLIGVSTGTAYALKLDKSNAISVCCIGDAATEQGVFWESLIFAALNTLPLCFICENNGKSVDALLEERQSTPVQPRVQSFGIEVCQTVTDAMTFTRQNKAPSFVEIKVKLRCAHLNMATMMDLCDQEEPID